MPSKDPMVATQPIWPGFKLCKPLINLFLYLVTYHRFKKTKQNYTHLGKLKIDKFLIILTFSQAFRRSIVNLFVFKVRSPKTAQKKDGNINNYAHGTDHT